MLHITAKKNTIPISSHTVCTRTFCHAAAAAGVLPLPCVAMQDWSPPPVWLQVGAVALQVLHVCWWVFLVQVRVAVVGDVWAFCWGDQQQAPPLAW